MDNTFEYDIYGNLSADNIFGYASITVEYTDDGEVLTEFDENNNIINI